MKTIYRTHQIKNKETLSTIANTYNLEIEELVSYHNERAEIYEQIEKRIPYHLSTIILPPEGYGLQNGKEVWLNKDIPEPNTLKNSFYGKLNFENPEKDITYAILKTIVSGNKENTIKYKLNIRFYPDNELLAYNYISIDLVSKVFINDQEPNLVADELATACMEALYPLVIKVDKNLTLLDIVNHDSILKRWKKHKEKKLSYYSGPIAEQYFQLFEQTILDQSLFFEYLQKDWFYKAFFNNIYCTYNDQFELENSIDYPILPNTKNIQYTVDKKATILSKDNRIKIEIDGLCTDLRNKVELEQGAHFPNTLDRKHTPVKGTYRGIYYLNTTQHTIQSMFLSCSLEMNQKKSGTITISEVEDDSDIQTKRHPKHIEDQVDDDTKKKKSIWKSLFS